MNCVDGKLDCIALLHNHGNLPENKKEKQYENLINLLQLQLC